MTTEVWDIVQKALIDAGIDTYAPAQKTGDCKSPYAVLKDDGSAAVLGYSSEYHYYTLLCYVPRDSYLELGDFVSRAKDIMSAEPIYPMLKPTGVETPAFLDDSFNAYMISVQYRNCVRNIHV